MLFKASPEEPGLKIKHKDQGGGKAKKIRIIWGI
jgi:hypothetical protein